MSHFRQFCPTVYRLLHYTRTGAHRTSGLYSHRNNPGGDRIRATADYLLKNNARLILTASLEVSAYLKAAVLQDFNDESLMIRNAAGQDVGVSGPA